MIEEPSRHSIQTERFPIYLHNMPRGGLTGSIGTPWPQWMGLILGYIYDISKFFRGICLVKSTSWSMSPNSLKFPECPHCINIKHMFRHVPTAFHETVGPKIEEVVRRGVLHDLFNAETVGKVALYKGKPRV